MLSRHGWESFEEIIDCFTRLKVIQQRLHRDSRPVEHGSAAHHVGATGDNRLFHGNRLCLNRIVFNIKGNDTLVVAVDFEKSIVWIEWLGTHKDYDKIDVKEVKHAG